MEAGAKGFLCKTNLHLLIDAIDAVLKGEIYMDPDIKSEWNKYLETNNSLASIHEYNFTKQDIEHFQCSATGLEYKVISSYSNTSVHCLQKRQKTIKEKTGISSRVSQTLLAIQLGIVKVFRL